MNTFSQFVCTTFEWIYLNVLLWIIFSQQLCSMLIELFTILVYGPLVLRHSRMHLPGFALLLKAATACRQLLKCGCMSTNCSSVKKQKSTTFLHSIMQVWCTVLLRMRAFCKNIHVEKSIDWKRSRNQKSHTFFLFNTYYLIFFTAEYYYVYHILIQHQQI